MSNLESLLGHYYLEILSDYHYGNPTTKREKEQVKPKIQSLLFEALEMDDNNYLEWKNDAKAYLATKELDGMPKEETAAITPTASNWKALLMLRKHLDYSLKKQYLQIDTSHDLWRL